MDVEPFGSKTYLTCIHRPGNEQFGSNFDWIDIIENNRGIVTA
jgi:hypothetical protein